MIRLRRRTVRLFIERREKQDNKMVISAFRLSGIATAFDDGEVIPVKNTPPRTPPLPEPPPWFHCDTSIDGDLISILIFLFRLVYRVDTTAIMHLIVLNQDVHEEDNTTVDMIVFSLLLTSESRDSHRWLLRSMYQVQVHDDIIYLHLRTRSSMATVVLKILCHTYNKVIISFTYNEAISQDDDDTIAIITQLVVLRQDIHDNNDDDDVQLILYQVKYKNRLLLQLPQVGVMNRLILLLYLVINDVDTIRLVNRLVVLYEDVHDETRADTGDNDDDAIGDVQEEDNTIPITEQMTWFTCDEMIFNYGYGYILINTFQFSTSINGEKYTSQSKYENDYIKSSITNNNSNNNKKKKKKKKETEDFKDLKISYDDRRILNGEYIVLSKDTITNTTEDLINSNMSILLYQDVHDVRCGYSTTTIDGELIPILMLLVRLVYRVDRMYQAVSISQLVVLNEAKYKMIQHGGHDAIAITQIVALYQDKCVVHNIDSISTHPFDLINGNNKFSTSINGEKYTSQSKYQVILKKCSSTNNIKDDSTNRINGELISILILLFRLMYRDKFQVQAKFKMIEPIHLIYSNNNDTIFAARYNYSYRIKLTPTTEDSSSTDSMNISIITDSFDTDTDMDTIKDLTYLNTDKIKDMDTIKDPISSKKGRNDYVDVYIDTIKDPISSKEGKNYYVNIYRKNGKMEIVDDVPTDDIFRTGTVTMKLDSIQYDYCPAITTSISYYCSKQIWESNNNYNDIRFNDDDQSRALHSEGQYKDEVYNAEEGMFQEPIPIITFDCMKENGERTTCYSNQDPCMIQFCHNVISIDSKDSNDMIATGASLRLDHSKIKIDINETTTLIRMFTSIGYDTTRTSIGDETTTSTIQNGDKNKRLDYNLVILIYGHVIPMIRLWLCILLIATLRLLDQSMGSVKIHKAQVKCASQLNQVSQMRARLEACLESGLVNQSSQIMSHLGHRSFSYGRNRILL